MRKNNSATLYEVIARAGQIAADRIAGTEKSLLNDSDMTLEALYDHALRFVFARRLSQSENIAELMRRHSIEFTNGIGDLPAAVLRGAMKYATAPDLARFSFVSSEDYKRPRFIGKVEYFTVEGGQIRYKRPPLNDDGGDESITVDFLFVTMPVKDYSSNGYTTEIDVAPSVIEDVILTMAGALTGEIKLSTLMENQTY